MSEERFVKSYNPVLGDDLKNSLSVSKSAFSDGLAELQKEADILLEAYREAWRRKEWEVAERYLAKRTGILMGIDCIIEATES